MIWIGFRLRLEQCGLQRETRLQLTKVASPPYVTSCVGDDWVDEDVTRGGDCGQLRMHRRMDCALLPSHPRGEFFSPNSSASST